jgi:hypothetical protein
VAILPVAGAILSKAGIGIAGIGGGAIASDIVTSIIAFQIAYIAKTWKYYKFRFKENAKAFLDIESDLLKLSIWGVASSIQLYLFGFGTLVATAAGTGSLIASFANVSLAVILNEIAYFAAMSVMSMGIYAKLKGLMDEYDKGGNSGASDSCIHPGEWRAADTHPRQEGSLGIQIPVSAPFPYLYTKSNGLKT